MQITVKKGTIIEEEADEVIVGCFSGDKQLFDHVTKINEALSGALLTTIKEEDFKAKLGHVLVLRTNGALAAKRVILVGLGDRKELKAETVRIATAVAIQSAKSRKSKVLVSDLLGTQTEGLEIKVAARAMAEGAILADYTYTEYKSKPEKRSIESLTIMTENAKTSRAVVSGVDLGSLMARATTYARDLVNAPGQDMHPTKLVEKAEEIAKGNPNIKIKIYDQEKLEKMGAGGILGVAQGSGHPPYMVHMTYKPTGKAKKIVALVGKAVTFDSGGLSLKPSQYMETMKVDMGGSATVLGAFSVISELSPKAEVHGIFAPCENMPSGTAIRPGDVLTAMNGKTIEVLNTDAEGRLTLADALTYAVKQKPDFIVDLATLTGSCVVALGEEMTGLMSNNDAIADKVKEASEGAGEYMWRLPLKKSYKKLLKSPIADMNNTGGRYGGAITAGLFLEEFVNEVPWVHLDIAGPAFAERTINSYTRKGATGHGTRTLLELLRNI